MRARAAPTASSVAPQERPAEGWGLRRVRPGRPWGHYDTVRGLCVGCPERQECLETAMADPELIGL